MTKMFRQFFNFSKQGKVWYFKACTFVGAYKTGLVSFQVPLTIFHIGETFWKKSYKVIKCSCQRKDTVFLIDFIHSCKCGSCNLPLEYGNIDTDFKEDIPKSAACAFRKKFQFDNSDKATTTKRLQCSLYLGHKIIVDSLPFTCLKQDKYQRVPGTEIPNAMLWGWNQLGNINLPHVPTADRFHWLLLHINTGNSASLKNKISEELTYSKHTENCSQSLEFYTKSSIQNVSQMATTTHPFRRLKAVPPAWPQSMGRDTDRLGERGRMGMWHAGLRFAGYHRSLWVKRLYMPTGKT